MNSGSTISIIGMILILSILLVVAIKFVDQFFKGDNNKNFYRMITICVGLNLMIFFFLVMTFGKIQFTAGKQGPSGNRGDKGFIGKDSTYNICHKKVMTSGERKHKILRKENAYAKKPTIVDNESDIYF